MQPTGRRPARRVPAVLLALGLTAAACATSAADRLPPTVPTTVTVPATPGTTAPPSTVPPGTAPPEAPQPTVAPRPGGDYAWQPGDCFDFGKDDGLEALPYAPYGDADQVPCGGPHTHDVYHVERVPEGADAPFPEDLGARVDATCSRAFRDAYGLVWPDSTYSLIRYLPDEEEWAAGERYLACMLYRAADGGLVERRPAAAGGPDDDWPAEPGTCFTGGLRSVRQPEAVECATAHTFEVVAVGTHPALAGDAFPSQSQLDGFMDDYCLGQLARFAGPEAGSVSVVPIRFGRAEWDLGYRTIRCLAFTTQEDQLALVRGSFAADWEVVGVTGGDVVTA